MKVLPKFVFVLSAGAILGCATYKAPQLPASEVAILSAELHIPNTVGIVSIEQVDDQLTGGVLDLMVTDSVVLAPGKRKIKAHVRLGAGVGTRDLTFFPEAGKSYLLRAQIESGLNYRAWIEDKATGEVLTD